MSLKILDDLNGGSGSSSGSSSEPMKKTSLTQYSQLSLSSSSSPSSSTTPVTNVVSSASTLSSLRTDIINYISNFGSLQDRHHSLYHVIACLVCCYYSPNSNQTQSFFTSAIKHAQSTPLIHNLIVLTYLQWQSLQTTFFSINSKQSSAIVASTSSSTTTSTPLKLLALQQRMTSQQHSSSKTIAVVQNSSNSLRSITTNFVDIIQTEQEESNDQQFITLSQSLKKMSFNDHQQTFEPVSFR
jgi:hypothetical protein